MQMKQLNSQLEQETQKRSALQVELKAAQQQISQLKTSEKQLSKVLLFDNWLFFLANCVLANLNKIFVPSFARRLHRISDVLV